MTGKRIGLVVIVLALAVVVMSLVALDDTGEDGETITDTVRMEPMDIKELEKKVLGKNWDALDIVDTAAKPEEALDLLTELMGNQDPEVREIALNCVAMIRDPRVPKIIAGALDDEDDDIRLLALQSLQTAYDESILSDLTANLENEDAEIRGGAALLLGQIGKPEAVDPLKARLEPEEDTAAERDIKLALAKLGDDDWKAFFADQMDVADSEVRLQGLDDLRFIGDATLAVRIRPALDDTGQAHLITDKNQPEPEYARVCDAAVNLVSELGGEPFDFEVGEFKIYSDEEIERVKSFLDSLKTE